jgi:hypothetical protein
MESGLGEMERALGGEQINTGVEGGVQVCLSPAHAALEWALRDTLVCGYREALSTTRQQLPREVSPSLRHAMDALVRLALIHNAPKHM